MSDPERPAYATNSINGHDWEGANDWQYGRVYWLALATEPALDDKPPPGKNWILNTNKGDDGRDTVVPAWSDGSIVLRRTYWRRPFPGMCSSVRNCINVNRRPWWNGSVVPARVLMLAAPAQQDGIGPE